MADEEIRVGLIGAGGNVRNRHIPGFQKVEGLEIIGVANRSLSLAAVSQTSSIFPGFTTAGKNCWKTMR